MSPHDSDADPSDAAPRTVRGERHRQHSAPGEAGPARRDAGKGNAGVVEEFAATYGRTAPEKQRDLRGSGAPRRSAPLVLVVDDDEPILELIRLILESGGYSCIPARSGQEAIEFFEKHAPEIGVLVTDLSMPGIDGATLIHALRQKKPHLPCIGMSGSDTGSDVDLWRGQMIEHVEKPFTACDLLGAVARLFPRGL